jgi:hypothetical protein
MRYDQEGGLFEQHYLICPTSLQAHTQKVRKISRRLVPTLFGYRKNERRETAVAARMQLDGRSRFGINIIKFTIVCLQ